MEIKCRANINQKKAWVAILMSEKVKPTAKILLETDGNL